MKNVLLTLLALCAFAPDAHADWMSATLGQPLTEVSHSVRVSIAEGIGTFVVQRTFANAGKIPDEAILMLELPTQAVATGLRIRAGQTWYKGDLLEAEEAAQKYEELTGIGVSQLKDPALLSWIGATNLELRVFPVPAGGTATLEYTLSAPAMWSKGRWVVDYPRRISLEDEGGVSLPLAPIVVTLEANKDHVQTFIDGRRIAFGQPVVLTETSTEPVSCDSDEDEQCDYWEVAARIEAIPKPTDKIVLRLGSTEAAHRAQAFRRLQVEMPTHLSKTPESAHVVFVMDRSYSVLTHGMVATQFQVMRAFAQHLPGGKFEVILTDRRAERLSEDFMEQQNFLEILNLVEESDLEFRNGSHFDEGLRAARELLQNHSGPRYIIAFTDDLLRKALTPTTMEQDSEILTHLVIPDATWQRDDDHRLAPIAHKAGGLLVHAFADETLSRYVEHLVRPIMLDQVQLEGVEEAPEILWEGQGFVDFSDNTDPTRLRGKLWHTSVNVGPQRSSAQDRATAGWVFSNNLHALLSDNDMMKLARFAKAVTPVTSYLAIEPGVRPSTAGLPMMTRGLGMRGMGASGSGYGTAINQGPDLKTLLANLEDECRQEHPDQTGHLSIHTTRDEVVDVEAHTTNAMTTCMVEGIWDFRLPTDFSQIMYSVQFVRF